MKPEQFSHRIGNIDDELVQQAENTPNFARRRRNRGLRRVASLALVVALMAGSFAVGALAVSRDAEIVYVEKEQETIVVGDSGISLILPEEWAGKYGYDEVDNRIGVYQLATMEGSEEWGYMGYLFWIDRIDGVYPMDYVYPEPGYTIASTDTHTYRLIKASDVQYDPTNEELAAEYEQLWGGIGDIQILLTDWLTENSTNDTNWTEGTAYVTFLSGADAETTIVCDEEASGIIARVVMNQDYSLEREVSVPFDLSISVYGETYHVNASNGTIWSVDGYAVLSEDDLQTVLGQIEAQH